MSADIRVAVIGTAFMGPAHSHDGSTAPRFVGLIDFLRADATLPAVLSISAGVPAHVPLPPIAEWKN